ncbi:HPr kinase [Mameliella alba]|uniref:3-oxo-tetronate kinase n=1 Tax=Mameliella alba TaxID=561184 RepID=A0A0B3RPF0_9RHOB|nr:3-oxo-tetronate kinase [Mameliella alba]KHQ53020.1 HPr kinase [Mameliella alba]BBU58240.1 HPr kinase [Mameliella alba]
MTTVLGAIADDFTGATDLAGLLARSGVRVSLRMGVPEGPPADPAPFEVIALKIRTAPVDDALAEARAALDWLRRAGAERFFWKYCSTFDSTPEGNIGPVAEALMRDLGAEQTIYCPAFPENGRSIFMGTLFVGEQPLGESPMKDHPLTPMRDSNLMRLLAPQVTQPVGLANRLTVARGARALTARLAELRAEGVAHVVVDAVANEDLQIIAEACRDMPLMTGGSAVAMPLPGLWQADGLLSQAEAVSPPEIGPGAVVLSGSCSAMTNAQVAAYRAAGAPAFQLDPLELADRGAAPAIDWLRGVSAGAAPLIYATADPASVRATQERLGTARAGAIVEEALAACAIAARDMGRRRFVVAGGESSGAVTQALGVTRLDVGREIAPGVPWCFAESGGKRIALTLKSGNFGAESFFTDALDMLDR